MAMSKSIIIAVKARPLFFLLIEKLNIKINRERKKTSKIRTFKQGTNGFPQCKQASLMKLSNG
jgi:hypothetical protein